jgi:hypothetical protein
MLRTVQTNGFYPTKERAKQLGIWVINQPQLIKQTMEGKGNTISQVRMDGLNVIDFEWSAGSGLGKFNISDRIKSGELEECVLKYLFPSVAKKC